MMAIAAAGALGLAVGPGYRQAVEGEPPSAPGEGLAGYEGSDLCGACHPAQHESWETSLHARTVREPGEREGEVLGQSLLCSDYEAKYVLGKKHAWRFMVDSRLEDGMHVLLPCRYEVATAELVHLHETDWQQLVWERGCGACHTTGFSSDDLTYKETGVGCESCHGPARRHGDYQAAGSMISFAGVPAAKESWICSSCHLQGGRSRRTGLNFAYNYEAGEDLYADYVFDWESLDGVADDVEDPIDIHQKLLARRLAEGEPAAGGLRCTSCHTIHPGGHARHEALPRQDYCHLCHTRGDFSVKEYNQACNVCEF